MMKKWLPLLLAGSVVWALATDAREVTVYRLQVGAYNTSDEAQAKLQEIQQAFGAEADVAIEQVEGRFPYKVRLGWFGTYEEARAAEKAFERSHGRAYTVRTALLEEEATALGISVPPDLSEVLRQTPSPASGMQEQDLLFNAQALVAMSDELQSLSERNLIIRQALPYLLELADQHPESASSSWVHHSLGNYYHLQYELARAQRSEAGSRITGATEEAALRAALAEYRKVATEFADSVEAEDAAYKVAACLYHTKQTAGTEGKLAAIEAYEAFAERFSDSPLAGRAKMNIGGLKFELAKAKLIPMEEAYAYLENLASASETLGTYALGRTLIMMAEIQAYVFHDSRESLAIASLIDCGTEQDSRTAAGAKYLQAEAHRVLGDYASAAALYAEIVQKYRNSDGLGYGFNVHPICLYSLGECQMELGDWDAAKKSFSEIVRKWPTDERAPQARLKISLINEKQRAER